MSLSKAPYYFTSIASHVNYTPVLNDGYIVSAWATPQRLRIVSIEDVSITDYQTISHTSARQSYIGKSTNVESALKLALIGYHKGLSHSDMYNRSTTLSGPSSTSSLLDQWLIQNKGTMYIVQDIDGSILCRLSGLINPSLSQYQCISIEGKSIRLQTAIHNTFQLLYRDKPTLQPKIQVPVL